MKVDRERLDSFASRFAALKDHSELAYVPLAEDMSRRGEKQGFKISPNALHKWVKGGSITPENLEFVADYFNCNKVWLFFGEKYADPPPFLSRPKYLKNRR